MRVNLRGIGWVGSLIAIVAACVDPRGEDALGHASFIATSAPVSRDYAPASSAAIGGSGPLPPQTLPPAGTAGTTSATPTQPPPGPTAGLPSAGRADAAGSGAIAGAGSGSAGSRAGAPSVAGTGSPAAGSGGGGAPTSSAVGMLMLDFTTVNQGGRYAPQNVGAVWIETASGMFVKTIERWGNIRSNHLTRWNAASGGWGSVFGGGGNAADMMDAVSRATLRMHSAHHLTWDMQDPTGKVVPDGAYNVLIEVTEDNRVPGAVGKIPFTKGPAPQQVAPADAPPVAGLTLLYQP